MKYYPYSLQIGERIDFQGNVISFYENVGLKKGDILTEINGKTKVIF